MNKYEFLKDQEPHLKIFIALGIASPSVCRHLEIFEFYSGLKIKSKLQKYEDTAEQFKLQPRQVMNIVKDMRSKVNLPPNSRIEMIKILQK